MPSRKKTNLSRKSRNAIGIQEARSQESEEDRIMRLSDILARQAASLSAETANQRESRLRSQRLRTQSLRSNETNEDRYSRCSRDRDQHYLSRASETFTQCEERLNSQRIRSTNARLMENEEERDLRLSTDRERHALSISSETFTQRSERLASQHTRTSATRSQENEVERDLRLFTDRERHALSRGSETFTQRTERLASQQTRTSATRSQENEVERYLRLFDDRERHALSISSETFTQRTERLASQQTRTSAMRSQENEVERDLRLFTDRERHALSISSETFTQRTERLASQQTRTSAMRSQENDDDRDLRLCADRERHALSISSETFTQRTERLASQQTRTSAARTQENEEERDLRLCADRERRALSLSSETFTQRTERLVSQQMRTSAMRTQELDEERERRLATDRERHYLSRESETNSEWALRLHSVLERYHETRLDAMTHSSQERGRIGDLRSSQSAEQRESQLESDRVRHAVYRLSDDSVVYEPEEVPWNPKEGSGLTYNSLIKYAGDTNIGRMTEVCRFCNALKWNGEANGMCCSAGKIRLDPILEPPQPLKSLLTGEHPLSKHFLDSIRAYNSAFQMTSFGAKQVPEPGYMPTFKVQGQVYHRIGALLPTEDIPKFLQIYFVTDYLEQANIRGHHIPNLNPEIITGLQNMLHSVNGYVNSFKAALESVHDNRENFKFVISADRRPAAGHAGRYNAPTTNEVAVVLVDQECDRRDVVLRTHDDRLQRISETHRAYDALQYPLMFCRGEDGYNFAIHHVDPQTGAPNYTKKITALQFYSYRLQLRQNEWPFLHRFKGLFSQFIVDLYAKIETERLVYIRTHQRQLRAENYVDLRDALQHDTDAENLGRMVILPSSFVGSDRYMAERTQDALCYVRKYGGADLFITFTCNPKWPEITNELLAGQLPTDRYDIVSRVFHLKQKRLIDLLTKSKVFGSVRCFMFSIEWQKRGLPHSHTLLWLEEKIRPNDIDLAISAELPNPEVDPRLYNITKTHMIHGPCGTINPNSPCMKNGRCTKRFPKALVAETVTGENGYPSYRRRSAEAGGFTAEVRTRGQTVQVDNRWIVPYSPVLSRAFETHLNVESCASIASIKYVCKYINKGDSRATLALQNRDRDEVSAYQSGRYICTSEAVWRTLAFPIHERFPTVVHLDVHLENGQRIYFDTGNVRERLDQPRQTTLLAFFRLCQDDDFAKTLLYDEVPSYFTYNKQAGVFNRRRRGQPVEGALGIFRDHALGRVYTIHPSNRECYYLRLLLHTVRGPTSFAALRTVDGVEHPTFHAACSALHLLDDDQNWDQTLAEAVIYASPSRLRHLFSIMLVFCGMSNPLQLWQKYQNNFSEDVLHRMRSNGQEVDPADERVIDGCLTLLQEVVTMIGGNSLDSYGLPQPTQLNQPNINREYEEATTYDREEMAAFVRTNIPRLNTEQRHIFNRVVRSIEEQTGEIFFLDAPGGTGKTFLTGILLAEARRQGKIALAVASSGIAATLLPGGKTAHTTFKIPIDLDSTDTPVCGISRNCDKARVLQECSLIVWDECTMAHKKAVEAVDRMLQDVRRTARSMGGVTMLFSGDFRQTLPVVTRGTRADEVNACLKRSALWPSVQKLCLTENMRAQQGGGSHVQEFARVLLQVGEGLLEETNGVVRLPDTLCSIVPSVNDLIQSVYGDVSQVTRRTNSWICERAILTPKNEQAAAVNAQILAQIDGEQADYCSINTVLDESNTTTYPVEFLNSLTASGLPAHIISLKVGVPIMLLRNLSPPKLCNGTRLKVVRLQQNLIEAEILTGSGAGEVVFIPRIPLIPNNFPFRFKRLQFPVSVCFAMTINKSQGQTLRAAGVDLRTDCFSHGQLYVACSRVTTCTELFVLMPNGSTVNVVYKEIL